MGVAAKRLQHVCRSIGAVVVVMELGKAVRMDACYARIDGNGASARVSSWLPGNTGVIRGVVVETGVFTGGSEL